MEFSPSYAKYKNCWVRLLSN